MLNSEYKPPKEIEGMTFLSKKAGSFSDVPQRTVQTWTEKGLIESETTGTGDRRRYTVLNCIEIGIIAALAKDRVSFDVISQVMKALRKRSPLTLKQSLADERAFLIIRYYVSGNQGISCVSDTRYGPPSGIKGEQREFERFWRDTTIPADREHQKTLVMNLSYIARNVEDKIKKSE